MELTPQQLKEDFKPYEIMMECPYINRSEKQIYREISRLKDNLKGFVWHDEYEIEIFEAQLELISRN